jgi:hypothetical protein
LANQTLAPSRGRPGEQHPLRQTVARGNLTYLSNVARNPNTYSISKLTQVDPTTWEAEFWVVDPTRRILTPTEIRQRQTRRKLITVTAATVGGIVGLFTAGWLTWMLWGDNVTAAARLLAAGAGVVALIALGFWWTNHGRNACPGLHCKGCGGH